MPNINVAKPNEPETPRRPSRKPAGHTERPRIYLLMLVPMLLIVSDILPPRPPAHSGTFSRILTLPSTTVFTAFRMAKVVLPSARKSARLATLHRMNLR